jgi:hypothetical protein
MTQEPRPILAEGKPIPGRDFPTYAPVHERRNSLARMSRIDLQQRTEILLPVGFARKGHKQRT